MKPALKSFNLPAVALTVVAACVAVCSASALAQTTHCTNLYNRVMATYQETGGYGSATYAEQLASYSSQCLSAGPSRPYAYQTPYQPQAQPYISPTVQTYAPVGEQNYEQGDEWRQRREWDRDER